MGKSRNFTKKLASTFLCVVLSCMCFIGCSNGDNKTTQSSKEKGKEKVTLSLWGSKEDAKLLEMMVESFKKHYQKEADFEITISPESEVTCKTTVLSDPKAAADVYTFAEDQLDDLVDAGALLPITEEKEQTIKDCGGEKSAAIEAVTKDGKMYAYPATSSNGYFLFYNSKYFNEDDVTSFDKMLAIAAKNKKKVSMDFTSGWYTYSFFKGAGLDVHKDKKGERNICDWNSTSGRYTGVDVLEAMIAISQNKGFVSLTDEEFTKGIKDGLVIAGVSGTWNAKLLEDKFGDGYAATKLPKFTLKGELVQMHSVVGYKVVGVNAYSKNSKWAQRLAAWITNKDNQELRFKERGEAPANQQAAQSDEVQNTPAVAALNAQSEYGHIQKVTGSFWTPACRMGTVIIAGNPKNKNLQKLLDETVEKIKEVPKKEEQ